MYDLILTHGYFLSEDEKEQVIMRPHPPLGLLYIATYLKKKGLKIKIVDSTFSTRDELFSILESRVTKYLGISTNLMTRSSVIKIIKEANKHGITVILGGPEATNYKEEYLTIGADYIVNGEGEKTIYELLNALKDELIIDNIKGVSYIKENSVVTNEPRELIKSLDSLPWPDREAINIQNYLNAWKNTHNESCITMITSRGCPYHCTWCSHSVYGFSHRRRDPIDCANELESMVETYNPSYVWYVDDVFTINHKWLYEYAKVLEERNLKVAFETITRADKLVGTKVLDTLKDMGCFRLWIGAESCSQRLLDKMKRNVTVEQIYNATKEAQKRGITIGIFLMWGYADENIDDIDNTVKEVARINPDIFFTTISYPIKGTEYYKNNEDNIEVNFQWENGSDREIVIKSRKSDRYYRYADAYLKSFVQGTRLKDTDTKTSNKKFKDAKRYRKLLKASQNESYCE